MDAIVVFANRFLGYHALKYLLENRYSVKFVVPAFEEDTHIEQLAREYSIPYAFYYVGVQDDLAERFKEGRCSAIF